MKKKIWVGTLVAFAVLSVSVLFMVACKKKEAPPAPTGVSAYVSGTTIKLTWNSVGSADSYVITDGDGYSIGTAYSTSYTDNSPSEGYNYYRVYARNEYGRSSSYSSTSCYYHNENGGGNGGGGDGGGGGGTGSAPSAPTGVSATVSGSQIKVSWNSVSNATSYKVYWSESGNSYNTTIGTTSNTYIYDNVPYENNYYKVKAINDYGESELSSYAYCHYSSGGGGGGGGGGTTAPNAPTGVTATNIGSTMLPDVKITWNSVSNATGYKVYKSTSPNSGYTQHGSETTTTYLYDHNPSQGNNYYKVKAVNSAGESSYSSYAVVNINSNNVAPCPPTVSASGTASSISVSWTSSTSNGCGRPTSYKVYKRNPTSGSYELRTTTTSTSYRDTDVHPGYNRYAVEAINDYGSDEGYGYSSEIPLSKPSSFSAQKSGNDRIIFSWSKVNQATGYDIFMSTSAYGTYTTFQGTTDNVTSLNVYYPGESGHTYYFKIRAYWRESYGTYIFSDFTTYKSVTF